MTNFVKEHTKNMRCVRKGKYHIVFFNPVNNLYEIWDAVEQCEFFEDKTEAIETMKYMDKHYMEEYM